DRYVQNVLSSYLLPANRDELVDELGSMRPFWSLDRPTQRNLLAKARFVTGAEIEALSRKAASVAAGLSNASPPRLTINLQQRRSPPDNAKLYVFSAGLMDVPLCSVANCSDKLAASWPAEAGLVVVHPIVVGPEQLFQRGCVDQACWLRPLYLP